MVVPWPFSSAPWSFTIYTSCTFNAMGSKPGCYKRHLQDINIHWKGFIKGFKMSNGGQKVAKIQVAHVCDDRDMSKEKISSQPNFPKLDCNCEYA